MLSKTRLSFLFWNDRPIVLKRSLRGDTLPGATHLKMAPRYVKDFRNVGMSRGFAIARWNCYKADCINLHSILSLKEQRSTVQNVDTKRSRDVPEGMNVGKEN